MAEICSFPCNDHKIFSSYLNPTAFERIGIVIKHDEDNESEYSYEYNTMYVNEEGNIEAIDEERCVYENYHFIGIKGEKITPKNLAEAISADIRERTCGISDVFRFAEKYCPLDLEGSDEVVRLRIDPLVCGDYDFRLDNRSKWFSFGASSSFYNFKNKDYKCDGDKAYGLQVGLIEPLAFYTKRLGREIKVDIDFCVWDNYYSSDKECDEINIRINAFRERFLKKIRMDIADGVRKQLERDNMFDRLDERGKALCKKYEDMYCDGELIIIG